jgi:hypothetical protein
MIDDHREVEQLLGDIQAQLPIRARSTPALTRLLLQQKGISLSLDEEIQITSVLYLGDVGGLACGLDQPGSDTTAVVTSLTHLRVDENHPLAERINAYQRRRSAGIAAANGQGPSALAADPRLRRQNRKKPRKRRG